MTTIAIFQQNGSGAKKVEGITRYGTNIRIIMNVDIQESLPEFIEDPQQFLPGDIDADLVLSFLSHPDLLDALARLCAAKKIPLIASGRKCDRAITPPTCCGLGKLTGLGEYGRQFGLPEFSVIVADNRIETITVLRGASCGATWEAAREMTGLDVETALSSLARHVQYRCVADPSAFDPVSGKSALHYAGDVHTAALKKALRRVAAQPAGRRCRSTDLDSPARD